MYPFAHARCLAAVLSQQTIVFTKTAGQKLETLRGLRGLMLQNHI